MGEKTLANINEQGQRRNMGGQSWLTSRKGPTLNEAPKQSKLLPTHKTY